MFLVCGFLCFIGVYDVGDYWMVYYVFVMEEVKVDFIDFCQYFDGMVQIGFGVVWQVNLCDVVGDYCFGVKVDVGQEYFYLFDGGVLVFIKNDKGVIQCLFVYIGQWGYFDDVMFNQFFYFFKVEYFKQCVIQWVQIWVDFLVQIVGQEVEFFVCFDGWMGQQNMVDFLVFQCIDCCCYCQIGFICICWIYVESDVVIEDIGDVLCLVWCMWFDYFVFGFDIDGFIVFRYVFGVLFQYVCFFDCQVDLFWFNILNLIVYWCCVDIQVVQNIGGSVYVQGVIGQFKVIVMVVDFNV